MATKKIYRVSQFIPKQGWSFLKNVTNQTKLWHMVGANGVPLYIIPQVVTEDQRVQHVISPSLYMDQKHQLKKIRSYSTLNQQFHRQPVLVIACPDGNSFTYYMIEQQALL